MKRAFLLMVVPALLVALGFAQTPAASTNADQTNIKGCLGGSDGNYTMLEDGTGRPFRITTSSVDLKPHVGHDVALIGHKASGTSSAATDNSVAVTALNMISEHCPAAATAPVGSISIPAETTIAPALAAAVPAATISIPAETAVTSDEAPAVPAFALSTPAETGVTPPAAPAATINTPAETVVTPATAPTATIPMPSETAVTPPAAPVTISTPVAPAVYPTRVPAHYRRMPVTPAAAATAPVAPVTTPPETVSTPDAAETTLAAPANASSETASTPAPVATAPAAPARGRSLWLLISFVVLVIVIGILAPSLSRWRKRRSLERTGTPNLSFTREASSDQAKSDQPGGRKVA